MIKRKIEEWFKRYLLAEMVGTFTALTAASVAHVFYDNLIITAYIGSLAEGIGFYTTICIQHVLKVHRANQIDNSSFSILDFVKIISKIMMEFGPAGVLDGLVLRPFFMCLFPLILGNFPLGIFVGKIASDLTFYLLVILSYEINKPKTVK